MKPKIHPKYYSTTQVTCGCGNTFTTGSTKPTIQTEVCSACHPFFTGQARFIDTQGRVERFQAKQKAAKSYTKKHQKKKATKKAPKTLKEMLKEVKKKAK